MTSDEDQETDHKTSQETWDTSLILQKDTGNCNPEQSNLGCVQWKLRGGNKKPKGNPPRLWFRMLGHHWNQKIIPSTKRQRDISRNNPKSVTLPHITDRGSNK